MANNAIIVDHLTKDFGEGKGTFDLTFNVPEGSVYGYCGPNGAGKTTTIRQMMGFLEPDKGHAVLHGLDAWKDAEEVKKYVGYLPGEIAYPDVATGSEFLKMQAEMLGVSDTARAEKIINLMQLDPTAKLKSMSKGMKQKTAIVAAFMAGRDILLLDEPTTGLDPLMRDAFLSLVKEEKAMGHTVFMSSHIFSEMEQTCDYVAFIKDGKLARIIDMVALHHPADSTFQVTFGFRGDYEAFLQEKSLQIKPISEIPLSALVSVPVGETNRLFAALSHYRVKNFVEIKASLERAFDELIQKED